jgi:hypothetical protein
VVDSWRVDVLNNQGGKQESEIDDLKASTRVCAQPREKNITKKKLLVT